MKEIKKKMNRNSTYQTHCPQMRTFALGDHYMMYTLLRVRAVMNLQRDGRIRDALRIVNLAI